jgi:CBS domain-containing protein
MKNILGYLDITPGDFKEIYLFAYQHALERLRSAVKAKDIMTKDVVFVRKDTPLEEVADILGRWTISGVPVIDENQKVAGVLSATDFLFHMGAKKEKTFMGIIAQCLRNKGCLAIPMRKQKAEDIMTSPAITIRENSPVSEIADTITENNINRVPVVNQNNRLVGIVTRTDIVRSSCSIQN